MLVFVSVIFSTLLSNKFSQKRNKDIKLVKDQTLLCGELSAHTPPNSPNRNKNHEVSKKKRFPNNFASELFAHSVLIMTFQFTFQVLCFHKKRKRMERENSILLENYSLFSLKEILINQAEYELVF